MLVRACLALLMIVVVGLDTSWAGAAQEAMPTAAVVQSQDGYSDLVDAGVHRGAVEALAADGVFDGTECAPGRFCPDDPITRGTMAVWLVRVLDGGDPEKPATGRFADVAVGDRWAAHIERLAELGVTRGCFSFPVARYCPDRTVTRAQMAAFLVRGFRLPPGAGAGFDDVDPDSIFRPYIDSLASAGITVGCAADPPARYCPNKAVTRAQMASFLHRARPDRAVRISWVDGPLVTGCPWVTDVICRGLLVQLQGDWEQTKHWLDCVVDERRASSESFTPRQHSGRGAYVTGCGGHLTWSGWGGRPSFATVHVIVDGIKSNALTAERL